MNRGNGAESVIRGNPEKATVLLVDDQPGKLLTYEAILGELGENLVKASSAREALAVLLKTDVALVLIDVCMPELDGFELATIIREHPRFRKTPLIFVSAVQITELDRLRGYEAGAVDYVPVPVVPELLRAKVKVFLELHRTSMELERLNAELEERVAKRTAELESVATRLLESEQRRSLALVAGRMGSWERNLLTGEYSWDEGQYRIYGVDPAKFLPTVDAVQQLIHADDLDRVLKAEEQAAGSGRSFYSEFRLVGPDGTIRWCIAGGAVTLDSSGTPLRLTGVTHDITDRKVLEETLQNQKDELEQLVEARTREREVALAQLFEAQKLDTIGQLTGGVAHDFNNLLMVILGSLELLRKRLTPMDPRVQRLLENAMQGADRGTALTQRLLAFARRQELRPQSIDIPTLIGGMRELLERAIGPGIQLNLNIPVQLDLVQADANQLELAVLNLAVNSRDAMPLGGTLTLTAVEPGGRPVPPSLPPGEYVCIEIADTGMGMDEETLQRSREPFFTTKGPGKGTGLGLSMVHGLAAQSGGGMNILSCVGGGTQVQIFLPKALQSREDSTQDSPSTDEAGPASPPQSYCVLLVDDDLLVRTGTAAMLEDLGHVVVEVDSGAQALAQLKQGTRIDVVITDHAMPGMTGLALMRALKSSYPEMPVILASGFAEIADDERVVGLPRLTKPFRQHALATAISAAAAARHSTAAGEIASSINDRLSNMPKSV
ncbi:MAG: multi-sensor hybrid histidine kinase [Hyphomicrobiales bacterium]|nr:multi-sensor hybrid histidine kinase [Hyphomicrobiales bacterium]